MKVSQKYLTKCIMGATLVVHLVACNLTSNKGEEVKIPLNESGRTPVPEKTSESISYKGESIGQLQAIPNPPEDIAEQKKQYAETALETLRVDPKHNTALFRVRSGPESHRSVYVAPKAYAYGSTGHVTTVKNSDGTISVPFNIAIIDGLSPTVLDPSSQSASIPIPESLRVKYVDELNASVKRDYGDVKVMSFPGCPRQILVVASGREYDVTPKAVSNADFCEINRPMTVNLTGTHEEIKKIMQDLLPNGYVDLYVRFDTRVPVVAASVYAEFDRSRLFENIKASLSGNYKAIVKADAEMEVRRILAESSLDIYIVGNYTAQMQNLVDSVVKEFFEPFSPDPSISGNSSSSTCAAAVCVSFKSVSSTEKKSFRVSWTQLSAYRSDIGILSTAKLQPANANTYYVGRDPTNGTANADVFTNANANPHFTPMTPVEGDIMVIRPTLLNREIRERELTQLSRSDESYCANRVSWWGGNACTENGVRTTIVFTQELSPPIYDSVESPAGKIPSLMGDLSVVFTYKDNSKLVCPLLALDGDGFDNGRRVFIRNTNQCAPIDKQKGAITQVGFINSINVGKRTYTAGLRTIRNFGLRDENRYQTVTYSPEARLAMEIRQITPSFTNNGAIKTEIAY